MRGGGEWLVAPVSPRNLTRKGGLTPYCESSVIYSLSAHATDVRLPPIRLFGVGGESDFECGDGLRRFRHGQTREEDVRFPRGKPGSRVPFQSSDVEVRCAEHFQAA